jgi:hypothetical protein
MRKTSLKAAQVSGREQCTPDDDDRTPGAHTPSAPGDLALPDLSKPDPGDPPDLGPPDLGPLRAAAERTELADALALLTDAYGYRLPDSDPLAPLARDIARSLVEAGFTLHHCARTHPLYRLGGVCLLPVSAHHDDAQAGVVVSWATHDLLSLDWDRYSTYHDAHQVMNDALADVLDAFGYEVRPFGSGGAWIVTGRRAQDEGTGQ